MLVDDEEGVGKVCRGAYVSCTFSGMFYNTGARGMRQ